MTPILINGVVLIFFVNPSPYLLDLNGGWICRTANPFIIAVIYGPLLHVALL